MEEGGGKRAAARHFRISPSSAIKLVKRWFETGWISPDARGRLRGQGKFAGRFDYLQACLAERSDLTMPDLADKLARSRHFDHARLGLALPVPQRHHVQEKVHHGLPGKAARILRKK